MTTASTYELARWQAVPERVAELLPQVLQVKAAHLQAANAAYLTGQVYATWQPDTDTVTVYGRSTPAQSQQTSYAEKIARPCVFSDVKQPDWKKEILIKTAGIPGIAPAFDYAQEAMGGPTPLTNALLIGLTAGGLGYGAGTLAENMFPEQYLERGRLRRTLGLTGALSGLGYGALAARSNAKAFGVPFWQGWNIRNDAVPPIPEVKTSSFGLTSGDWLMSQDYGNSDLFMPNVDTRRLNNAIWRDTNKGFYNGFEQHTPPAYAATATGFMSGLSAGKQSPIVSPSDIIQGLASAGVGLVTANIAGKTLSALAGLTPMAQEKLQNMGMWGGMMHALVPSMLGMR